MAISLQPLSSGRPDDGRAYPARPAARPVEENLKLIADLARALDDQCRRAGRQLDADATSRPDVRAALQLVSSPAREAAARAPALIATRPAAPPAPELADDPDSRQCAVALAVSMKLEGAARQDVEDWLRDEFGRQDARAVAAEAFGSPSPPGGFGRRPAR